MKKFLFLTTAVFLLLAASLLFYVPVAKASSPAEFVAAVTKRSNTGQYTVVTGMPVDVHTVRKSVVINNAWKAIPLAGDPYNGSHLDSDNSGRPDTNDIRLYANTPFYNWGVASKENFIWCGNYGGVPDGEFELDVELFPNQYLGEGHWEVQWFEMYGGLTYVASSVVQGTKARVQALNPRQTSVWFTFVENSPPPVVVIPPDPSVGSITIAKRGYFGNETGALSELKIGETLQRGQVLISPDRSKKLVMQEDGNLAVYIYHGYIWQAAVLGSNRLAFQSDGNLVLWKDNADGLPTALWSSGSSGALGTVLRMQDDGNLVMYKDSNPGSTAVWFSRMQKYWVPSLPYTNFAEYCGGTSAPVNSGCYLFNSLANTNSHLAASNEVATAPVLVSNAFPLTGSSVFHSSQANPSTVNGVWVYPEYYATGGAKQPYWTTVQVPAGKQVVKAQISINGVSTDKTSTVTCTGANKTGTCTLPGLTVLDETTTFVDWWMAPEPVAIPYYPWLQTKNGDVTSSSTITGQVIGSATDRADKKGARPAASLPTESSFVIAALTPKANFCSDSRFALGQLLNRRDNATPQSCQTGGYAPTAVNFDKVKASIAKAYADNGNGVAVAATQPNKCNPKYATGTAASLNTTLGLGCPSGGIQKIAGPVTLPALIGVAGRGTLWVTGDLTISGNITYGAATNDPKTTPNLVIFVEGNVFIGADVTQIDASIISMETISTCKDSETPGPACSKPLTINGFLASDDKKINFARRFYNQATPSPAELINLTSQSTTFPAPGLDRTDVDVTSKLQINGGEFAPRLN